MDRTNNLAVDLKGNVLTCQNVSAAATAPNGQPHLIGQLSDLPGVQMKTATHWSQRRQCASCPVLQLCKGSCMFLEGQLWEAGCDAAYSDNLVFLQQRSSSSRVACRSSLMVICRRTAKIFLVLPVL
jgi:uncharacterized protein